MAVDPFGGVSSKGVGVEFQISEGGLGLTREAIGDNWRVGYGNGWGRVEIGALDEHLTVGGILPLMVFIYSRESGTLVSVLVSGVDLASLAGTKMALAPGDWEEVSQMKRLDQDRLIHLVLGVEEIALTTKDVFKRTVTASNDVDEAELNADTIGFIPGRPTYVWNWDLRRFEGRVGFEVFGDRIVFYYEKNGEDARVRLNIMEVPRQLAHLASLDERVKQGMPNEEEIMEFMEGVYIPLL